MLPNPLQQLSLEQLRTRTSLNWRQYPQDVLPLWVAEMDVPLAQPIASALHEAIDLGDTGYPAGTAYAEAFAEFAIRRANLAPYALKIEFGSDARRDPTLVRPRGGRGQDRDADGNKRSRARQQNPNQPRSPKGQSHQRALGVPSDMTSHRSHGGA